ncbi:hypothetical protein OPT61_g7133 [Boeremia exigua]|uniref:Uncharacterized protein n=1 Tax=Boeremia exigua TaxID=749465 RepID=A0ACC2I3K4_9PLEO|nr:hypothetical protein OPT61_g7133 [Boeremia exigua]
MVYILPVHKHDDSGDTPLTAHLVPPAFDLTLVEGWIKFCSKHHSKRCPDPLRINQSGFAPIKVIDCLTREVLTAPKGCTYIALSYVWGSCEAKCPIKRKLKTFLPPNVPQTVEDAMTVVLALKYKYLWVDQYCINQTNTAELHSQLNQMHLIYNHATLTIVAAAGQDAHQGLPGVSHPRSAQNVLSIDGQTWISSRKDARSLAAGSKWATRAWTYQEDFFSRQSLSFTEEQVVFSCDSLHLCESLGLDPHRFSSGNPGTDMSLYRPYLFHIEAYSRRQLTYQGDVLKAIQGVFGHLKDMPRTHADSRGYGRLQLEYWGIPTGCEGVRDNFACGLLWEHHSDEPPQRRPDFPSWSWAGWVTPVEWDSLFHLVLPEKRSRPQRAPSYDTKAHDCWDVVPSKYDAQIAGSATKAELSFIPPEYLTTQKCSFSVQTIDGDYIPLVRAMDKRSDVIYEKRMGTSGSSINGGISIPPTPKKHVERRYSIAEDFLGPTSALYTMNLAITADIVRIHSQRQPYLVWAPSDSNAARNRYAIAGTDPSWPVFWPLSLTVFIEQCPHLHSLLLTRTLEVILLHEHFGLLVWHTEDDCERLGILQLKGRVCSRGFSALGDAETEEERLIHVSGKSDHDLRLPRHYDTRIRRVVVT